MQGRIERHVHDDLVWHSSEEQIGSLEDEVGSSGDSQKVQRLNDLFFIEVKDNTGLFVSVSRHRRNSLNEMEHYDNFCIVLFCILDK